MRRNKYRNLDPREIEAKFDSICAETGKTIKKGEKCIYYPSSRDVFCLDSKQAQEFREMAFDRECLGVTSY